MWISCSLTISSYSRPGRSGTKMQRGRAAAGQRHVHERKKIVVVVTGEDKAEILRQSFFGPVTPQVPEFVLQFHPDVTLICDEAAFPG